MDELGRAHQKTKAENLNTTHLFDEKVKKMRSEFELNTSLSDDEMGTDISHQEIDYLREKHEEEIRNLKQGVAELCADYEKRLTEQAAALETERFEKEKLNEVNGEFIQLLEGIVRVDLEHRKNSISCHFGRDVQKPEDWWDILVVSPFCPERVLLMLVDYYSKHPGGQQGYFMGRRVADDSKKAGELAKKHPNYKKD